ncbi:MAG: DUF3494 domain-containing protein [Salinivirgaceae bacterium]|nr:DUF3494 domain-containing protein [Salinivirgaceae bacterium]
MKIKSLLSAFAIAAVVLTAGCNKDEDTDVNVDVNLAPTIILTDPTDNALDITLNKVVSVEFSEAMDTASINDETFTLKQGETAVTGVVAYSEKVATFTSSTAFEEATVYTVTMSVAATDLEGKALAANKVWSFTTLSVIDEIAPTVVSTDPVSDATDVARQQVLAVNFSEAMDPLTINTSTFTLMQGENAIDGTVNYNDLIATFTPSIPLEVTTTYTAKITTEVSDLAGNALEANTEWSFTTGGSLTGQSPVDLGSAINYVILAKTAINNNPTSAITGDLGLSPAATSYITGFDLVNATGYATSAQVTGQIFAADMAAPTSTNLTTAVENMITAYNDAAGRPTPDFLEYGTGNIGGKTLTPGLYKWTSTVTLPSDVTISGSADDVWIFQIAGDLNMSTAVNVTLIGGAKAENIFWQVAGEATFGATSHFEGIILSMTGITFQTGASFNGRALAQTAVVLDANTIGQP